MSKNNFNKVHIQDEDLPYQLREEIELVDFSEKVKPNKDGSERIIMSESVKYGKETLWKAVNNKGEYYWTNSTKSPQIVNTHTGRGRGNIAFINGDVAKLGGRPAGAKNKVNAKTVCDNLGIHPAEYAAAILTSDPALCRKYGIKDIKEITIKNKEACMKELYNRMEGQAKAQQLDKYGDVVENQIDSEKDVTDAFQIYIPKASQEVSNE